ncbi:MAG: MMPL family transporter [Pseudomonadota bacterium]
MALGVGFGAERVGTAALRFPKLATACLIALMVLVGMSLPGIRFDDDINRAFLTDSPLSQAQRAYDAAQDPPLTTVLAYISADAPLTADQLTVLRNLALDLEFLDGVEAVASPFVLRWPPTDDVPTGKPVFGPEISADYAADLSKFEELGLGLPILISPSREELLISVSIDVGSVPVEEAVAQINEEIGRVLPNGVSARLTGEDVISAEVVGGLKDDLLLLNLLGAALVTLCAFVMLRDLRMALLAVVPAAFGAAGVLALSVWLGYPLTVLSNVIPTLLLVIGVADGVHLAGHVKETGSPRDAVRAVGPACALTALTTAVAFSSIMLTGNAQLFEFGVLGALGTMLSFVIVLVTFALMATVVPLSPRPVPQLSATVALRVVDVGLARPRATVIGCLVLLGFSVVGYALTTPWFPVYQNLPGSSQTRVVNDKLANNFGGAFQLIVETDGDWAQTRATVEALEEVAPPNTVLSELNFARWLGDPEKKPTAEDLSDLPTGLHSRFRTKNGGSRIFVAVPEPMRSAETLVQFDRLRVAALAAGADRVIGLPAIMRQEAVSLIRQLSIALVVASLGATLMVALAFKSARLVPVLLVPNILPLMVAGATLHLWAQGLLTPPATLALTIAFGIAIDDTVHYLNRFAAARAAGESAQQAVLSAALSTGQVLVLTTLLLTVGIGVTLFSDFTPVRLFGGMMILTLWVALLVDLFLLPALLTWRQSADEAG